MKIALSKAQRSVLALGLLLVATCLLYVPYEAIAMRSGDNLKAHMRYAPLWSPPSPRECAEVFAIRVSESYCQARPALSRAIATSFAAAVGTTALLIICTVAPALRRFSSAPYSADKREAAARPTVKDPNTSLADLLRSEIGEDFPVAGGNATIEEPLIISAEYDYVSVEYAAVQHILKATGETYELKKQAVRRDEDRVVDELIFNVKRAGTQEWSGVRRFFFDITEGFNRLGK